MKHTDGSWSPSYNVQVQTELQSRMVVGIEATRAACDAEQLVGGLETVARNTGVQPTQMLADGGYVSRQNVEKLTQRGVALIAPWQDADERSVGARKRRGIEEEFRAGLFAPEPDRDALRCPQGRCLEFMKIREHHDVMCKVYEAAWEVCQSCACRPQCCPTKKERGRRVERVIEPEAVQAFERRMQGEADLQAPERSGGVPAHVVERDLEVEAVLGARIGASRPGGTVGGAELQRAGMDPAALAAAAGGGLSQDGEDCE